MNIQNLGENRNATFIPNRERSPRWKRLYRKYGPSGVRADFAENHYAFCSLIHHAVHEMGEEVEGEIWVCVSRAAWAKSLGVSKKTITRLMKHPPIVAKSVGWGQNKRLCVRLGPPPEPEVRDVVRKLRNVWLSEMDQRNVPRVQYNCLVGLALDLPDGWQVEIFRHVLRDWQTFASYVKLEVDQAAEVRRRGFDPFDHMEDVLLRTARALHGQPLHVRFMAYPNIAYIRRFHWIATDAYIDFRQGEGLDYPERCWF